MTRPLQIYLEEPEWQALQRFAQARGWTLSRAVRVALKALVEPPPEDPLLAASGMVDGLPRDLSMRVNEYLNLCYVAEPLSSYGPKRKRRPRKAVRR